jgi:hypothetical protein
LRPYHAADRGHRDSDLKDKSRSSNGRQATRRRAIATIGERHFSRGDDLRLGQVLAVGAFGVAYAALGGVVGGALVALSLAILQYPLMRYATKHIRKEKKDVT